MRTPKADISLCISACLTMIVSVRQFEIDNTSSYGRHLTLCMLDYFSCFCCRLLTFFKRNFFKKYFRNTIRVFGPRSGPISICSDLGPKCLQRSSPDANKERVQLDRLNDRIIILYIGSSPVQTTFRFTPDTSVSLFAPHCVKFYVLSSSLFHISTTRLLVRERIIKLTFLKSATMNIF